MRPKTGAKQLQTLLVYTVPLMSFLAYEQLGSGTGKLQNLAASSARATAQSTSGSHINKKGGM